MCISGMGEVMPVTVADLRNAYEYNESAETYSQETVYNSPDPPFLEGTDYCAVSIIIIRTILQPSVRILLRFCQKESLIPTG